MLALAGTALVLWILDWLLPCFITLAAFLFSLQFFRDPPRAAPEDPQIAVSPVDGRVCRIQKQPDPLTGQPRMMISIFMNLFDVHSQKSPVAGIVEEVRYEPGRFLSAELDKSSTENERNAVRIRTTGGLDVTFVQIAGLIARRITCRAVVGKPLAKGERYGFIRFGSRVDVYLPAEASVLVFLGQKLVGGFSPIARLPEPQCPNPQPSSASPD